MTEFRDSEGTKRLYITAKELALVLSMGERTVQRWIAEGFFDGRGAWPGLPAVLWVGDQVDRKPMLCAVQARVKAIEKGYDFSSSRLAHMRQMP